MSERYALKSLFARGGMAEVYLGVAQGAEGFERPVAIKRILPHLASDPRVARMFTAEAKLASYLQHQNVVQTIDVGEGPDGVYIVMELVNGWDLGILHESATRLGVTFPAPLVAWLATQVLAGLSSAYKKTFQGKRLVVAHRDISPSNILVSTEGEVKVADFGIARVEALGGSGTEPGTFKGKVAYASPEMLRAEPATEKSDQFALGIVMHELCTGRHPFGDPDNLTQYIHQLQQDAELPLEGVAPELAAILRRMLAHAPEKRFETPEAVTKALGQYLARAATAASGMECVEFIQTLHPPPPLSDRLQAKETEAGDTMIRASFSLHGQKPSPQQLSGLMAEVYDPDWKPAGPVMDVEGRIDRGQSPIAAPTAKRRPVVDDAPLELATRGPRRHVETEAFSVEGHAPVMDISIVHAAHARKPFALGKWLVLGALGLAGSVGYTYWPRIQEDARANLPKALAAKLPAQRTHVLKVDSAPEGATVLINGTEVGQTPYLTENLYPRSELKVTVSKKGYWPWTGSLRGGEDAELNADLERKR
jgi:eukaryotic-like serine/threonine-protein kinase